ACTVADACRAGVCTGGPRDCDDGDTCTIDACTGGGCVHKAMTGFPGAVCALGAGADALAAAGGDKIRPAPRPRLIRLVGELRATVTRAAHAADAGKTMRVFRLVHTSDRLTREVGRALQSARRRLEVSPPFADELTARVSSASRALDALRGGPAL